MTTTTTPVQISAPSLAALFLQRVEKSPDKEAFGTSTEASGCQ